MKDPIRKFIREQIKSLTEKNNEPSDAEYDQMAKDAEQDDLLKKAAELGYIDLEEAGPFKGGNYLPGAEDIDFDVKSINMVYTDFGRFYGFNMYSEPGFKGQREKFSFRADVNDFLKLKGIETEIPEGYDMDVLDSIVADLKKQGIEAEHHDYMDVSEGYTSEWDPETAAANQEFIRKREKEEKLNTAWAAFKKAERDGDIRGQELALAMMDLIQNEPRKKVRSPESEKFRKKVKDYLAKKKAKNLKESQELKLGVKYDLEGKSGYIMTGGSKDPKDWTFSISGSDQKLNYLAVKNKLTPSEKQPGKYDGAFDLGQGKGHHIDESNLKEMASELGYMNEESTETGLMVIPRTRQDANKIYAYLDDSNWTADWNSAEGYFLFPEEEDMYDSLEAEIEEFLVDIGVNARIEGVFNENKQININEAVYTDPNTGKSYDLQFVSSKNRWELDIMKKGASIYSSAITTIKRKTVEEIIDWLEGYNIDSSWVKKSL
jgi:hypothetical protein